LSFQLTSKARRLVGEPLTRTGSANSLAEDVSLFEGRVVCPDDHGATPKAANKAQQEIIASRAVIL
jgi:hypothetical protein